MGAMLLIAGHMVGDYVFQTNRIAAHKLNSAKWRTIHVLAYTAAFIPAAVMCDSLMASALFLLSVGVPHWIVDCRRWASAEPWPPKPIMVDQAIHAACLAASAAVFGI